MIPLNVGKVFLIGAGPGDAGLITVRGAQLIGRSDVVLYDGLVNESLLDYAPQHAIKICVGKHGHGGQWHQNQIDDEIVRHANQGKLVARLKGGDTAIFARTAEEIERLIQENIPYEVVPGITAALAASAFAGIPLTHRDWSSAVALVTGQMQYTDENSDNEESLDWKALAQFPGTLVMYMGVTTADHWSKKLIDSGMPPATPVAIIRRCSWPDQTVLRCELGSVATTIAATPGLRPPVTLVWQDHLGHEPWSDWKTAWQQVLGVGGKHCSLPRYQHRAAAKLAANRRKDGFASPIRHHCVQQCLWCGRLLWKVAAFAARWSQFVPVENCSGRQWHCVRIAQVFHGMRFGSAARGSQCDR
jgi:uroporphyrin-III C-methyltransferase